MTPNGTDPTGGLLVVKLGGTTLAEQHQTLADVAELSARQSVVVVHGGGRRLTEWLERLGIETGFAGGLRVTDDQSLEVAAAVLGGLVNSELVATLRQRGADAVGLTGIDGGLLAGQRRSELGRVVTVRGGRPAVVLSLLSGGFVPVVAPLALDEQGVICNVNADDAAAALAASLHARLVLLTDTDGVRDDVDQTIRHLDETRAEQLIASGVIGAGMVPKVRSALSVLHAGATEVVIADGRQESALQRALDDQGFGTHFRLGAGGAAEAFEERA